MCNVEERIVVCFRSRDMCLEGCVDLTVGEIEFLRL